jgi:8-oxo-dGTP diphosphatase
MSTESKAKFSVGVSVLIVREGKLLLGRRQNTCTADGLLSTPGGRIEINETMFNAAVRETMEETGISVEETLCVGFKEHFRYGKHYFMFYMWAVVSEGVPRNLEPHKCEGWQWVDINKIPADCTEPPEIIESVKILSRTK